MNLEELKSLEKVTRLAFPINSTFGKYGQIVINEKIAIPVEKYASYFKTNADISVLDVLGNEIGLLCFTSEKGEVVWNDLTENQFIAFLIEANYSNKDQPYKFIKSYLIIKEHFYEEYVEKYKRTAPIWGGFYHHASDIITDNYTITINEIGIRDLKGERQIFIENSVRAIAQPYAFERFLKYYHLLELRFDFDVVKQIQTLNIDLEAEKIGELLSDYSENELIRLEDIISKNCPDINAIVAKLNLSYQFQTQSNELFFKFSSSKKGNPFGGQENKFEVLILNGFEEKYLKKYKVNYQNNYKKFITKLVTFWIYRFRCSVAHNKIGEYLLSMDKENYVVEFAEPLLKEVIIQCFQK